ncbi:MAG TPA: methionine--tRNA ligase [Dehalococcoidia bacterium]|nr:methionine--tRNA ligase [Dehalococcoidia bacterium]
MSERIAIGVAWPYANGSLHLGQIAGAYLPADIFARYHRAAGSDVLMVSGSDQHGTPITVRAESEGVSPQQIVDRFHAEFLETWPRLGISFDLFTATGTENHRRVVQDVFLRLYEKGDIYKATMTLPYCPVDQRFLLDRYVEGTCPHCGFAEARGDQCDNCGRPLDPLQLHGPRCKFCGTTPEPRESEHFFMRLSAFTERIREWVTPFGEHWRRNVYNFTLGILKEGLHDRAITRDIEWGVPIPLPGYEKKRIYVWFEAFIGYLSASMEWAQRAGEPEAWRPFWQDPATKSYYFIGKDNIFFHTIWWPAVLMAHGDLILPYDVPANQYLTMSGSKASTSRNWAVWAPDALARYDADAIRYTLAALMPETSDSDFTWAEFLRRNNDELVATWGNLANRVLTFTVRNFDGRVPERGQLDSVSVALLQNAKTALGEIGDEIAACRFRSGLAKAMALAQDANRYLDERAPWKTVQDDRESAGQALYTAIAVIGTLRTAFSPYLPFSSDRLRSQLGLPDDGASTKWCYVDPVPGTRLGTPEPLFRKLDPSMVEEEEARMGR